MGNKYFIIIILLTSILGNDSFKYPIKKCSCEWNQIQTEDGFCVDHNSTFIHVFDSTTNTGNNIHLSEVSNVVVTPLVCSSTHEKVILSGFPLLSSDGQLLPSPEPPTNDYCIENIIFGNGEPGQLYEFCVFYEPFPLCCPPTENMNDEGQCGSPKLKFSMPHRYVVDDVNCSNGESSLELVPMDNAILTLKHVFDYYNGFRDKQSCLATSLYNGEVTYVKKTCCEDYTCVESCCKPNEIYILETDSCELAFEAYSPLKLEFSSEIELLKPITGSICNSTFVLDFSQTHHTILVDGTLSPEIGRNMPPHSFCLGLVSKNNVTKSSGMGCGDKLDKPKVLCMWRFVIVQAFFIISSIFIVFTIAVYLLVKDLRNRTSGACLLSELIAMLISQVNLIVIQMNTHNFTPRGCLAAGVIEIIFILASFFWLNVMCFDLWKTFRELTPFSQKLFNIKRFLKYSLYAWGVPILIGLAVVAVELLELNPRPSFTIYDGCFFNSRDDIIAQWIYLYSFIVVLFLINAFFFANLIIKIKVMPKKRGKRKFMATKEKEKEPSTADIENAKIYGKLFIIMGLPWIIEALSAFATGQSECYIWILDIINLLRGLLIFIIFVCKRSTIEKFRHTWSPSLPNVGSMSSTDRSRKTSNITLSSWLPSRRAHYDMNTSKNSTSIKDDLN